MKKLLLILFFCLFDISISNANELTNIPIIKKLDKKYLNLIDKNGKITDLKEFNKNGMVLVFNKIDTKNSKQIYLIINKIIKKSSGSVSLNIIYTKSIEQYFLNKQAEIDLDEKKGRYKAPIMYFNLDINNFLFTSSNSSDEDLKINSKISELYYDYDNNIEEISKIATGYLLCIAKTKNNIHQTSRPTFGAVCQIAFYDKKKEQQIKNLLNVS